MQRLNISVVAMTVALAATLLPLQGARWQWRHLLDDEQRRQRHLPKGVGR